MISVLIIIYFIASEIQTQTKILNNEAIRGQTLYLGLGPKFWFLAPLMMIGPRSDVPVVGPAGWREQQRERDAKDENVANGGENLQGLLGSFHKRQNGALVNEPDEWHGENHQDIEYARAWVQSGGSFSLPEHII